MFCFWYAIPDNHQQNQLQTQQQGQTTTTPTTSTIDRANFKETCFLFSVPSPSPLSQDSLGLLEFSSPSVYFTLQHHHWSIGGNDPHKSMFLAGTVAYMNRMILLSQTTVIWGARKCADPLKSTFHMFHVGANARVQKPAITRKKSGIATWYSCHGLE